MGDEQEEHLKALIRAEIERLQKSMSTTLRWFVGVFGTLAVLGAVKLIQSDTQITQHMADGHPQVVLDLVHSQAVTLGEIKATQEHIREDIAEMPR